MSMQSHYQINVSLNGRHFFATSPHSLTDSVDEPNSEARKVHAAIVARFPVSEGFKVGVTRWEGRGHHCEW